LCGEGAGATTATTAVPSTPGATIPTAVCDEVAVRSELASTGSRTATVLVTLGLVLLALGLAGVLVGSDPDRRLL